ncbi:sugar phosphate isomerase/epimerase [Pacificibacter sp. AS14]|uniref:sugar phosphate isomerase/epimerase family protein n=1 Tax=Pacificibacter sp. AS14 TaxID=3135785 RepID=UPI00317B5B36
MPTISYQLYSSRNWDADETFAMLAEAGYKEVEGVGPHYEDLPKTKARLERFGMTMPTGHFAPDFIEQEPEKVIEIAKTLGMTGIIAPYIPPEERPTTMVGWTDFATRLAKMSKPIVAAGLDFAWHNHEFEFVPIDDQFPQDLIAAASPDIKFELDLAWVQVAGQDPVAWLQKYSGRIIAAHVKDLAPEGDCLDEGGWADVGHGVMDWNVIKPALDAAGVTRYVVEHDNPSDHTRMATRSLASVQAF